MRLITRKVYRAFPELDPFDDSLCSAFVRVAASSWRARVVRQGAVALIAGATIAIAIVLSAALYSWRVLLRLDDGARLILMSIPLALTLAAGFLAALVVRDRLLRRRVRAVLRDRGGCPHCGYRLLGVPVDADCRVVCPECGQATVVDAAMGELAAGSAGQRVYNAVIPRIDERGRRRRRRVVKSVAWGAGSLVSLLLISYGLWLIVLVRDARAARAERDGAARWRELIAAAQPIPGSLPRGTQFPSGELEGRNDWLEFEAALSGVMEASQRFSKDRGQEFRLSDGRAALLDFSWLVDDAPRARSRGQSEAEATRDAEVNRSMARAAVATLEADGVVASVSSIRTMDVVMRPTPETDSRSGPLQPALIELLLPHLGPARQSARLCVARMSLALEAGDPERYVDALDTGLAIARVLDTGTTLIERMVATAIESLLLGRVRSQLDRFPNPEWTQAVAEVLDRRRRVTDTARAIRGDRQFSTDTVKWLFAQPARVQRAALLGDLSLIGAGTALPPLWRLGTYRTNLTHAESHFADWIAYTSVEPHLRPAGPSPVPARELPVLQALTPALVRFVGSDDQVLQQRRELDLLIAIRLHTQRTGRAPTKPDDLVPSELAAVPIDPYSGRPLTFTLMPGLGSTPPSYRIAPEPDPNESAADPDAAAPGR